MDIPEDDPFLDAAREIEKLSKDSRLPKDVQKKLVKASEKLAETAKEFWEEVEDKEEEHCPSCSGMPVPKILQIVPAQQGLKAVFAEPDSQDPTKMSVDSVVALAAMEDPEGGTFITGVTLHEDGFIECQMVGTFMGYIREGESPDKYAKKVQDFLADRRKREEETNEPG